MALILNIDTATDNASVCISDNGKCLSIRKSENQKEHASFINAAINTLLAESKIGLQQIEAFAVTAGPGSYTGLRVGMATAKGFCYALSRPLITVGTLEAMTIAAIELRQSENIYYCPMIDARRLEVFTAIYTNELTAELEPVALILEEELFRDFFDRSNILFFGSGSTKYKQIQKDRCAIFSDVSYSAEHVGKLADKAFEANNFANLSYTVPDYLKEFYTISK